MRDAKSRNGRKQEKNHLSFCFTRFGTSEPKVRRGRESADFPTDSPFRAVRRYLSRVVWDIQDKSTRGTRIGRFADRQSISGGSEIFVPGSLGHPSQNYVRDVWDAK
ncbi:hypothetical protein KI387_044617, partial [Taxus chinensis]